MNYDLLINFIKEHYPENREGIIALHEPILDGKEKEYLIDCIDTGYVSTVGAYVTKFEDQLKKVTGSQYAVAMVNGTCALHIALMISGVTENTEVIVQPLTFIATCNAVKYAGAYPVFVDVDLNTMGMCPKALRRFLETETEEREGKRFNKKTNRLISACVPMHVFGHACDIKEISKICSEHNIPLIEDAAEAIGSYSDNKHLGTFGQIGMLSFNGNKTITCGGGGALITDDESLAQKARHLSTTARIREGFEFIHDAIGYNYRLTNVNAAIGCAQLERLEEFIKVKRHMAKAYEAFISDLDGLQFMTEPQNTKSNYWFNTVKMANRKSRDELLERAQKNNIQCRPVWKLMPDMPMYKSCEHDGYANASELYERLVNIPSSANAILNK